MKNQRQIRNYNYIKNIIIILKLIDSYRQDGYILTFTAPWKCGGYFVKMIHKSNQNQITIRYDSEKIDIWKNSVIVSTITCK